MRILYVAPVDASGVGGFTAHIRGMVEALALQGHEVRLLTHRWRHRLPDNARVIDVPLLRVPGLYALSFGLCALWPFLRLLIGERPHLVYARYGYSIPVLMLVARALGVPFVVELNSDPVDGRMVRRGRAIRAAAQALVERWVLRLADGVVAVAPGIAEALRPRCERLRAEVTVIANASTRRCMLP